LQLKHAGLVQEHLGVGVHARVCRAGGVGLVEGRAAAGFLLERALGDLVAVLLAPLAGARILVLLALLCRRWPGTVLVLPLAFCLGQILPAVLLRLLDVRRRRVVCLVQGVLGGLPHLLVLRLTREFLKGVGRLLGPLRVLVLQFLAPGGDVRDGGLVRILA